MKASQHQVSPEEYILAPLSAQERLEAAFRIAQEAFKVKSLSLSDVESAVRKIRKRLYAAKQKTAQSRR